MRLVSRKSRPGFPTQWSATGIKTRRHASGLLTVALLPVLLLVLSADVVRADDVSTDKTVDPKIAELIHRVRVEEAKYRDLEVVTRRSHRTLPGARINWSVRQEDETLDSVRQTGLLYAHVQIVRTLNSGKKLTQELVSAFDGERTRTVEVGNSVNVHLGRYEPSQVVPPHAWALAAWKVNFDLSTFLGGMHALAKDRKVRRIRYAAGTVFEFSKLDFRLEGEETVDGLRCVKIHCERWNTTQSGPTAGLVWLALDRNLICAKMQAFYGTTREAPDVESVVKEWREIGPGLWLPAKIHSAWKLAGQQAPRVEWDEDFTLEEAKLHPHHPAAFFRDVPMPQDLPTFTIDERGRLADDALLHVKPVADPKRRAQEVLVKIRENEALYATFQASIERNYRVLSPSPFSGGGMYLSEETKIDVVRQVGRSRVRTSDQAHTSTGVSYSEELTAFDGTWSRSLGERESTGESGTVAATGMAPGGGKIRPPRGPQRSASLHAADTHAGSNDSPHLLLFDRAGFRSAATFADWLTSEINTEYNQSKNEVTYLGTDLRDGLECDVLTLVTLFGKQADDQAPRMVIWLAKDRNYLPVRREWRETRRHLTLPTGCVRVTALSEARPGVWYPQRIEETAFVATEGEGLVEDRLIVFYRRDTVVHNFSLAPQRPEAAFHNVLFPADTQVNAFDVDGNFVGRFRQQKTEVATPTDEMWTRLVLEQLRKNLKRNETPRQQAQRFATVTALVGHAPPELPQTWVNGKPIAWNAMKGKTVLLYFWAEWDAGSCQEAKQLAAQRKGLANLGIELVGAHAMGTSPDVVDSAAKRVGLSFPVCIDGPPKEKRLQWGPLWTAFGVRTPPAAVVVDATGHVADFGPIDPMLFKARELARHGR